MPTDFFVGIFVGMLIRIASVAVPAWFLIGLVAGDLHMFVWPWVYRVMYAVIVGLWVAYTLWSVETVS